MLASDRCRSVATRLRRGPRPAAGRPRRRPGASPPPPRRRDLARRPGGPGHRLRRDGRCPPSTPADFRLEVDGRSVPVESAVWIAESPNVPRALPQAGCTGSTLLHGRLLVLLFQKDFEGSRLRGLLRAIGQAKELLAPLSPRDRVAVLTFDSHLRLHLDFTPDMDAVRRVLDESVLLRWPGPIAAIADPPRSPRTSTAARPGSAASPEQALLALGRALESLPGAKTVLLFGWGLGRHDRRDGAGSTRTTTPRAPPSTARAPPSSAWTSRRRPGTPSRSGSGRSRRTRAASTSRCTSTPRRPCPGWPPRSPAATCSTFERPEARRGEHRVRLSLARRRGTVLTRTRYVD